MLMEFVFEVVLMLVVSFIGIIGNLALIIMFAKMKKKQLKFHWLMIVLSGFDTAYILLSVVLFAIPGISEEYRDNYHPYIVPLGVPIIQVALTGSVYCTTAISIERYLIVCKPFGKAANNWSTKRYLIPIFVISLIYNSPRFFEMYTETQCWDHELSNIDPSSDFDNITTSTAPVDIVQEEKSFRRISDEDMDDCVHVYHTARLTEMRENKYYYSIYTIGLNFCFMGLFPFLTLVSSAILILKRLIAYEAERDTIPLPNTESFIDKGRRNTNTPTQDFVGNTQGQLGNTDFSTEEPQNFKMRRSITITRRLKAKEIFLARVSLVITFVFMVCHSIRWIPNIYELIQRFTYAEIQWPYWVESVTCISHFLTVVNSSVNFYIYYFGRHEIKCSPNRSGIWFSSKGANIDRSRAQSNTLPPDFAYQYANR